MAVCLFIVGALEASGRVRFLETAAPQARKTPAPVEWLTDAEGREYRLEPLPKAQGVKTSETRVRTIWGVEVDLGREDAEFFYLKLYRVQPVAPPPVAAPAPAVTEPLPPTEARLSFEPFGTGLPSGGQWREGVVVADVTGDPQPEIVAGPARKSMRAPTVFGRTGQAWAPVRVTFPPRPYDYGALAWTPAQGHQPGLLVAGVHQRGLIALSRTGAGAFDDASSGLPFQQSSQEAVFASRAVALGDCNGDSRPDLIALGEGMRPTGRGREGSVAVGLAVFTQQEERTWTRQPVAGEAFASVFGSTVAVGDVDGDGHLDVAVAPGQFGEARIVGRGDGRCGFTAEAVPVWPRSFVTSLALADLDGDKRADLIAGTTRFEGSRAWGHLDVYRRGADGAWTRTPLARLDGRARFDAVDAGDIDGDGRMDVAAAGPDGETFVFYGTAKGGFVRERATIRHPARCTASTLLVRDLDDAAGPELVIAYARERTASSAGVCDTEGGITAWKAVARRPAPRRPARD